MNTLLDSSLVGVALLVSAGYAIARLGPRSLRKRGLESLSRLLAAVKLGRFSRSLATAAAVKADGACGGCDNCASESSPAPPVSSAEIKVPVANIGRRA